jgi:hypothetical protein
MHGLAAATVGLALKRARESLADRLDQGGRGASGQALLGVFAAPSTAPMRKLAETVLTKSVKVYYFDSTTGAARDISELDVDGEEAGGDGWGGLIESSDRANNAVATAAANAERQLRT